MLKISSRFFTLNKVTAFTLLFLLFPSSSHLKSTGEVYLVLGSDTAIWDGMDVARFDCYYRDDLYTGPTQNAYQVMDPAFRASFTDSVIIDQNKDSGRWVRVGRYVLPADTPVQLTVIDDRMNTNPQGVVLRADAIKIALIEATNSIDPLASVIPETFYLGLNFPNPFNPVTTIPYYLPVVSKIRVLIYNINGQLIRTLIDQNQPSGWHKLQWDGTDQSNLAMSSGIYFYRLFTGENILTGKMIRLK